MMAGSRRVQLWGWWVESTPPPVTSLKGFPGSKSWHVDGQGDFQLLIYPARGGSMNMTISDMLQNSGQKYDINLLL